MPQRSFKSRNPMVVLFVVPLLLVGYVLSVGPALRIAQEFPAGQSPIVAAYIPLFWVLPDRELLTDSMLWYLELWGVEMTSEIHGRGILGDF